MGIIISRGCNFYDKPYILNILQHLLKNVAIVTTLHNVKKNAWSCLRPQRGYKFWF